MQTKAVTIKINSEVLDVIDKIADSSRLHGGTRSSIINKLVTDAIAAAYRDGMQYMMQDYLEKLGRKIEPGEFEEIMESAKGGKSFETVVILGLLK